MPAFCKKYVKNIVVLAVWEEITKQEKKNGPKCPQQSLLKRYIRPYR
jgi:hypothetical protein